MTQFTAAEIVALLKLKDEMSPAIKSAVATAQAASKDGQAAFKGMETSVASLNAVTTTTQGTLNAFSAAHVRDEATALRAAVETGGQGWSDYSGMVRGATQTLSEIKFSDVRAGLNGVAEGSGITVTELGLLDSAGMVLGAGIAGWGIGRAISDFLGLDDAIGRVTARMFGLGNLTGQEMAAKQDSINLAVSRGANAMITYAAALEFNDKWVKEWKAHAAELSDVAARMDAPQKTANLIAALHGELQRVRDAGTFEALRRDIESHAFSVKELADAYRVSPAAIAQLTREMQAEERAHKVSADAARKHAAELKKLADEETRRLAHALNSRSTVSPLGQLGPDLTVLPITTIKGLSIAGDELQKVAIPAFAKLTEGVKASGRALRDASDDAEVFVETIDPRTWGEAFTSWLQRIPDLVQQAFTGGGGLRGAAKAIGSAFGADMARSIFDRLSATSGSNFWDSTIGKLLGQAMPVVGSLLGPAIKGLMRLLGKDVEGDLRRMGQEWGITLSKALVDQIAKDVKAGMTEQAAMLKNLSAIIAEAGGVASFGVEKTIGKMRDLFVMLGTGQMTAKQVGQVFEDVFAQLLPEAIDRFTGLARQSFLDLIDMAAQFGVKSKAVTDFLMSQLGKVVSSFNQLAKSILGPVLSAWDELQKGAGEKTASLQKIVDDFLADGQEGFDRLGRLAAVAFAAAIASGKSFFQALEQIGPSLDLLLAAMQKLKLNASDSLATLLRWREWAKANQDILDGLEGINGMLSSLSNLHILDPKTFQDLAAEARRLFDRMVGGGLSADEALRAMAPTLQLLWELMKRYGFKVDEATQKMIELALAEGLIGEEFEDPTKKMVDGLKEVVRLLELIAIKLGAIVVPPIPTVPGEPGEGGRPPGGGRQPMWNIGFLTSVTTATTAFADAVKSTRTEFALLTDAADSFYRSVVFGTDRSHESILRFNTDLGRSTSIFWTDLPSSLATTKAAAFSTFSEMSQWANGFLGSLKAIKANANIQIVIDTITTETSVGGGGGGGGVSGGGGGDYGGGYGGGIAGFAKGALVTKPTIAAFAEGGETELAGPIGFMTEALAGALKKVGGTGAVNVWIGKDSAELLSDDEFAARMQTAHDGKRVLIHKDTVVERTH
jgi:hypothetical protein